MCDQFHVHPYAGGNLPLRIVEVNYFLRLAGKLAGQIYMASIY